MIRLTKEHIILMHQMLIEQTGGSGEIRDEELLQWVIDHQP